LVDCGVASDVETVVVDGQVIMHDRHIPDAPPLEMLLGQAQRFAQQHWDAFAELDWRRRQAGEAFPNAYDWVDQLPDA
jgi:hypothetical protein